MKILGKLKLNQLSKAELEKREMNILVGGYACICPCACVGCICSCDSSQDPWWTNSAEISNDNDNGQGVQSEFSENLSPKSLLYA